MFTTRHSQARLYVRMVSAGRAQLMARSSAAGSLLLLVLLILDSPHTTLALDNLGYESQADPPLAAPPPPQHEPPVHFFPPPAPPLRGTAAVASPPYPVTVSSSPPAVNVSPPPPVNVVSPSPLPAGPAQWPATREWNDSIPATDFRAEYVKNSFLLWPENLPYAQFAFKCQQEVVPTKRNLTDFTYKGSRGRLQVRPYFDLGWVDKHYTPFYRHWRIDWRVDVHRLVCPLVCEYTDIQRLYEYRLYRNVLLAGFASGLIALAILQFGVLVSITLLWVANSNSVRRTADGRSTSLLAFLWEWGKNLEHWPDFCPDWVHLVLLTVAGFTMMEAAGHSSFFKWQSMLFYNFGVTYTYLTLLAMLSSTLFQCAQFSSRASNPPPALSKAPSKSLSKKASTKKLGPLLEDPTGSDGSRLTSGSSVPVQQFWDSDDWKYQRIFGQIGVLILMSMYLLLVDDHEGKSMDSLASVIVGVIVVANIWSFAVATVVALRSARRLSGSLFSKFMCTRNRSLQSIP